MSEKGCWDCFILGGGAMVPEPKAPGDLPREDQKDLKLESLPTTAFTQSSSNTHTPVTGASWSAFL